MSSKQKTKSKSDPWGPAQAGLKDVLSGAEQWGADWQNRPIYQDSTVQGFDPAQTQALGGIESRAQQGSPLLDQSQGYIGDVLSGQYLEEGNPHFGRLSQAIRRQVMPGVNQTFSAARRTGAPAHQYHLTKALGDAIAPIAYQDYAAQQSRMDQAAQFAPHLAREDYFDLDRLYAAGGARQQQGQAELSDEVRRFYEEQNRQLKALQEQAGLTVPIAGLGGTQTSTTSQSANPLTTAIGAGMTGASMFTGMPMGPMMGGMMGGSAASGVLGPWQTSIRPY